MDKNESSFEVEEPKISEPVHEEDILMISTNDPKCQNVKQDSPKSISDLPELVLDYILAHLSHFEVLKLRLISHLWNQVIQCYLDKTSQNFTHYLANYNVQWVSVREQIEDFTRAYENRSAGQSSNKNRSIPRMSPRYHHSACYVDNSMFVFGGCISSSTAYNDLWRFDVHTRKWHRIIAGGNLPLPRLFCSFTYYERRNESSPDLQRLIVVFGGFLFDEKLDVKERLLSTIHLFDIDENRWTLLEVEGETHLRSGNHSAVIVGDELIVFNGLRMVDEEEVDSNELFVFDLKKCVWKRQKTNVGSLRPFARSTLDSYRNRPLVRRKMVQTPFVLDTHHILYICDCNSNVLYIASYLLKRSICKDSTCSQCSTKEKDESEPLWQWIPIDISKIGLDFEFTYGGQFCKIGDLLVYLAVKNVAVPITRSKPPPILPLPRELISHANKRRIRERRIEVLDHYQRHLQSQMQEHRRSEPIIHRNTLQLRLLDTSRVISEKRIYKIQHRHDMQCDVSPQAISCYSLVASDQSLLLFGGFVVDQQKEIELVSNKLFMIVSKPARKLY